jgi:hypothetical protein
LSPTGKESGAKTDNNSYNSSTEMKSSKSESSDEEEGNGKTGPNTSSQNSKFTFFIDLISHLVFNKLFVLRKIC